VDEHFPYLGKVTGGGIHQSFLDEKLEMISSLDFLQFTIHNHDSGKSTTQKHDPEILTESCFFKVTSYVAEPLLCYFEEQEELLL
jgi:hypothetical protein